jgi:hypothetical protein
VPLKSLLSSFFILLSLFVSAQEEEAVDSISQNRLIVKNVSDSLLRAKYKTFSPRRIRLMEDPLTPSKASFYSAVIPGLGQAYLGQYWKVPIVYAAMGASMYYFLDNDKISKTYRNAYKRRLSGYFDDEYLKIIPEGEEDKLIKGMKFHRSYRDISALLFAAAYVLNVIEANVAAHMLQFNINDELAVQPELFFNEQETGLRLAIKF